MKTVKIYSRKVLERTKVRDYRFKEITQVTIINDGKEIKIHRKEIDNPSLEIQFKEVLNTRSTKAVEKFISTLGRSESDKFLKDVLTRILAK